MVATTTKVNIDKAKVRQLFKIVVEVTDEINETSFVHGKTKCLLPIQPMEHVSEFYVPNILKDQITLSKQGCLDINGCADLDLVNN